MLLSQGTKINSLYNNYDLNENSANSLNWVRLNNSILAKPNIALIHIPTPKEILVNKLNENMPPPMLFNEQLQTQLTDSLNVKNIIDANITPDMTNKQIKDKILDLINNASQLSDEYQRNLAFKSLKQLTALYLSGDVKKVLNDNLTLEQDIQNIKDNLILLNENTIAVQDLRDIVALGTASTPVRKVPLTPELEAEALRDLAELVSTPATKPSRLFGPEASTDGASSSTTFQTPSKGMKGLMLNDKTKQDIIQKMKTYGIELLTPGKIYFEKYENFNDSNGDYPANTAFIQRGDKGIKTNRESINYIIGYTLKKEKNTIICMCYGKNKNNNDYENKVGVGYDTFTREENLKNVLMISFIEIPTIENFKKMVRDVNFQSLCDLLILNNVELSNEYTTSGTPSETVRSGVPETVNNENAPSTPARIVSSIASYFTGQK
jgi:hypothetical protein